MLRRDWRRIAEGRTADIFELDERRVLKLFKQGYSMDAARREYENHRMVSGIMAQVPRVFACAAYEGRVGLTMENVRGPSLASRMLDARTFEQAMDLFAQLHMSWLSHTAPAATAYTDRMLDAAVRAGAEESLLRRIRALPPGDVLCHGDFHPYNIVLAGGGRPVIVDFANVCRGPAAYDIARTYVLLSEADASAPLAGLYRACMRRTHGDIETYISPLREFWPYEVMWEQ